MLQPKMPKTGISLLKTIAAVVVTAWLSALAPARAADPATPDDTARFLAGLPPSAESPLMPLTKEAAWQRHARFFDTAFGQLEQRQLSKVKAWSAANLSVPRPTMFYMFSGPDFLYTDAFYSSASTYVLSALEPVGAVPDLEQFFDSGATLSNVERSLSSMLNFSFFITHDLKINLDTIQSSGALPILYVFLVRSGKTIRDVNLISLDKKGTMHFSGEDAGRNPTRGVRIAFAGADGIERVLYYFSTDLSNDGVRNSGFLAFCATVAPGDSLIKSASYLLHSGNFSVVRNFLLNNSASIIQDDSGIPLADYDPGKWHFFPFGHYAGPIDKFPNMYQLAYAKLFERAQPMDFGIGYRWRSRESNLLLSVRSSPDGSGAVATTSPADSVQPKAKRPKRLSTPEQVEQPRNLFFWR
jgi:hypothetical protein